MRYFFFDYGLAIVAAIGVFGLGALTNRMLAVPEPLRVEDDPAFRAQARMLRDAEVSLTFARLRIVELETRTAAQALDLDTLRRGAVWLPLKPADVGPADLIPPQQLPVKPAP